MKKFLSLAISWSLLVYFLIAFYHLSLNPAIWPSESRSLFCIFGPMLAVILSAIVNFFNYKV
jgi:hypothetical protein